MVRRLRNSLPERLPNINLLRPEKPASVSHWRENLNWIHIYTVQLSGISDSKLMELFAELTPHCIVLLEDVDTAGMVISTTQATVGL